MKVGVFIANIRLERTHFRKERLGRLHIGEVIAAPDCKQR